MAGPTPPGGWPERRAQVLELADLMDERVDLLDRPFATAYDPDAVGVRMTVIAAKVAAEKLREAHEYARAAECLAAEQTDAGMNGRDPDWQRALAGINGDVIEQIEDRAEDEGLL